MDFVDFFEELFKSASGKGIAWLVVPVLSLICYTLLQYGIGMLRRAWIFANSRRRALAAVGRERSRDGMREGQGVWLTRPIDQPEDYVNRVTSAKILSVANLKGGVGKTTLTANIGAYLANDWGKRVLMIDLDFQGSLSSMAFPDGEWLPRPGQNSTATKLISNDLTPDLVDRVARDVRLNEDAQGSGRLKVITAYYDLAQADNRLLVEWLLKWRYVVPKSLIQGVIRFLSGKLFRSEDVRYTLANILQSDAVRDAFDIVIIDCPPRLTTSEIQAFCASSHLLIPTIFDRTSAEAVFSLCRQIEVLKSAGVCPHLKYLGVVGSMWQKGAKAQQRGRLEVARALHGSNLQVPILSEDAFVPRSAFLVNEAESGIAYLTMPNGQAVTQVRSTIENLGNYIVAAMGIPSPIEVASPPNLLQKVS